MQDEWQRGIAAGIYKPVTKPCRKHGHTGARYVNGNACVECRREYAKQTYREILGCQDRHDGEKERQRQRREDLREIRQRYV